MENVDLHCHSTFSDGELRPRELVRRAAKNGVEVLALTDHDNLGGLDEAREEAAALGIRFIDGVEISVSWQSATIHVVGLGIDPHEPCLVEGLEKVRAGRDARAAQMAEGLAAIGIKGAYEGALRFVRNPALISRSHFARWMVEQGYARDVPNVFEHYLVRGKPGFVEHQWCTLSEALSWIKAANGIAVLAHPGRYRQLRPLRDTLLREFKALGGEAIEVVSGSHTPEQVREYAHLARTHGFLASRASDFHVPGESAIDLGRVDFLPPDLDPVWKHLS